jgi:hypothetical protein
MQGAMSAFNLANKGMGMASNIRIRIDGTASYGIDMAQLATQQDKH